MVLQTITDAVNFHTFIVKILMELLIKNLSSAESSKKVQLLRLKRRNGKAGAGWRQGARG